MKEIFKRLFCKNTYAEIENTRHMTNGGMDKYADFKCKICGKTIYTSIFSKRVNK